MDASKIKTLDDFNKLELSEKIWFKENHKESFVGLFAQEPIGGTEQLLANGIAFNASAIKSPSDFEKLPAEQKLFFRDNHNEHYRKLFSDTQ